MDAFAEFDLLFQETVGSDSIDQTRTRLRKFVDYMRALPDQQEIIVEFSKLRQLSVDILNEAESFMYNEDMPVPAELLGEDTYTNHFSGRYCYPVKGPTGDIIGLLGYDKFEIPKYLDSKTYGYKAKSSGFFGMENIAQYYESNKPVIFLEGSVCALTLREHNFHSLAFLGSYISPYCAAIMRRFGRRCIVMPDSDEAGTGLLNQAKRLLPEARVIRVTSAKDIDDSRQVNSMFFSNLEKMLSSPFINLEL